MEDCICLELPLNVVNVDKAVEALGGSEEIAQSSAQAGYGKEAEGLQLSLRNDRFHHPIRSAALPSHNIVVEIEVPKYCFETNSTDIKGALAAAANDRATIKINPKFQVKLLHRFREIADFQYSTADSSFVNKLNKSIFAGNLAEIQKLSLEDTTDKNDIIPPPRFTLSTQPFYYGYKQSPYVKLVEDRSGEQRLIHTSSTAKVISNVLNWGDTVPTEPPEGLDKNPRANIKECIDELQKIFNQRPSYTRRALQHKLGSVMNRYLKYALPYISYYYRSGPWRGAYIKYGYDPSKDRSLAKYQVEHFRISSEDSKSGRDSSPRKEEEKEMPPTDYVFDGTVFPDVPLIQLSDIADPYLKKLINTKDLRTEIDINDGWYSEKVIAVIRKVLRAELVALKEGRPLPTEEEKDEIAENAVKTS